MRYLKDLHVARRMRVLDAIFWWQISKHKKQLLIQELMSDPRLAEYTSFMHLAVAEIMRETRLSRRRTYELLDGKAKLSDFYDLDGYKQLGRRK
jgi:hypothetical protein